MRGLRLHFVNTKGTATALDRLRSRVRGVVSGALSLAGSLVGAHSAAAAGSQPPIVTRQQWGADQCPPRASPSYGSVDVAFVHHTVTATDYGPQDSAAMVLAICRYHRNSNGWNDIGYNFLVDRYGTIFEGRAGGIDQAVVGAQAQGYNSHSTGSRTSAPSAPPGRPTSPSTRWPGCSRGSCPCTECRPPAPSASNPAGAP